MTYLTYDAPSGQTPILEYYRYDVFGQPAIYSPDNQVRQASLYSNRFLFTGREYNANFGFYEYRARAYHPGLGRFMSEDPKLFDAGDYNLFRYCHNDPVDNVDPMGLVSEQTGDVSSGTHDREWEMSASEAVWQRQMLFSSSLGASAYGIVEYRAQQFDQVKQQFNAQSGGLMRNYYNHIPQLARLGLNRAIASMIGVVGDPRNARYFFGSFGLAIEAVTKVTQAFLTKHIQVGSLAEFKSRNTSGVFAADYIHQRILVHPTRREAYAAVPIDLTHEGYHLAVPINPRWGNHMEQEAMRLGHGMGSALGIPQQPVPDLQTIHNLYGYPDL
ncbi:MAG TPA: RHS repeat-associated core domain-containing protein [Terriglobales bacterium]|nr:RHS repeat-associated core domain-containing protein [Terriglobales bacterium]